MKGPSIGPEPIRAAPEVSMRPLLSVCVVFLQLVFCVSVAPAQQALQFAGPAPGPGAGVAPAVTDGSFAIRDNPDAGKGADESPGRWSVGVMAGLPLGVRVQCAVGPSPDSRFLLEGFGGLFLVFPAVGAGARVQFTPLAGAHNALVLSPGIDVYAVYWARWLGNMENIGLVSGNVDIAWRHTFAGGCDGQFGVELGVAGSFASGPTYTLPVATFYAGWRF
jgi:hypothetical protein